MLILIGLICLGVGVTLAVLRAAYVIYTADWDDMPH